MRLHVLIRLQPLRIYFNRDAVVRLASEKFEPGTATFKNKCMHITNQAYQVSDDEGFFHHPRSFLPKHLHNYIFLVNRAPNAPIIPQIRTFQTRNVGTCGT